MNRWFFGEALQVLQQILGLEPVLRPILASHSSESRGVEEVINRLVLMPGWLSIERSLHPLAVPRFQPGLESTQLQIDHL